MINNEQVELVECYYNGEFSGYDTKMLHLKNGRIALNEFNNTILHKKSTPASIVKSYFN